jgi:PHP family Zn ribbon phosphoesterase
MDIKDGATVLANYGSTTTIGQVAASQNNILISSGAMYFRNNTTNIISITSDGVPAISLPSNGTINLAGNDSTPAKIIMSGSTASCEQYVDTYGNYLIYNKTDSTHYSRITFSPAQALSAVVSLEARYGSYLGSVYYSVDGIYNTFTPSGNKTIDLGLSFLAWDDCYADDFNNVADIPFLDDRDDLKFLMEMEGSGIFDERTGLEIINDDKLPDFVKAMKKDGSREILLDPDGKPYFTVKAMLGWHNGCIRQLVNEFRDHMKQFH